MSAARCSAASLLLVGVYSFCVGAPPAKPTATDRHGDALPEGAVARLGTARLRGLCDSIRFSADGKRLVGVDGGWLVRVWDAADGKLLETRPLPGRPPYSWFARAARSPDGRTLLIAELGSLEMRELPSGKRLEVRLPRGRKRFERLALSDDRRLLLLAETVVSRLVPAGGGFGLEERQNLLLWDTTTGKLRVLADDERQLVGLAV